MLSQTELAAYRRDGFIVLPEIFTRAEVEAPRRVTDEFVSNAATSLPMTRFTTSKTRIRRRSRGCAG